MSFYLVTSPEVDPPEFGCDAIEIIADSKRDAIMLGVQEILRTQRNSWAKRNREDSRPPWAGYKAEKLCT